MVSARYGCGFPEKSFLMALSRFIDCIMDVQGNLPSFQRNLRAMMHLLGSDTPWWSEH